jgi:hypothetical protein
MGGGGEGCSEKPPTQVAKYCGLPKLQITVQWERTPKIVNYRVVFHVAALNIRRCCPTVLVNWHEIYVS